MPELGGSLSRLHTSQPEEKSTWHQNVKTIITLGHSQSYLVCVAIRSNIIIGSRHHCHLRNHCFPSISSADGLIKQAFSFILFTKYFGVSYIFGQLKIQVNYFWVYPWSSETDQNHDQSFMTHWWQQDKDNLNERNLEKKMPGTAGGKGKKAKHSNGNRWIDDAMRQRSRSQLSRRKRKRRKLRMVTMMWTVSVLVAKRTRVGKKILSATCFPQTSFRRPSLITLILMEINSNFPWLKSIVKLTAIYTTGLNTHPEKQNVPKVPF